MSWNLTNGQPIYLQLIEQLKRRILSGKYACGEHFPSVRELAAEASVNPNTMQKALAVLEEEGLLVGSRTNGRTVTTDQSMIQKMRNELATKIWKKFVDTLRELGFSESEIQTFISANAAERGTYDSITDNGSM